MNTYSSIIEVNKQKFMLYNGNNYGQTGIGLAKLIS